MVSDIRILVVDDEEIMRSLFTDILQDEGYQVITVSDGSHVEEKLKEASFLIAFIDVHMPIMDGVQTLRLIKKLSPRTAVVMMDSFPDVLLDQAEKEGAITCIHKPFNIQEVKSAIAEIIKKQTP